MGTNIYIISILSVFSVSFASQAQPQVAFMCNKPAVYLTDSGWVQDRTTDCLHDPRDILALCQRLYPDKEITNVVESSSLTTIDNWCGFDASRCHQHSSHTVRPFRCLVGPFQSDALLVPEHCVFDHIHGSQCGRYMHWNQTAFEACWNRSQRLDSFAMLQPCLPEIDVFNGVEYVCCPMTSSNSRPAAERRPFIEEDDRDLFANAQGERGFWNRQDKLDPNDVRAAPSHNDVMKPTSGGAAADKRVVDDAYRKYIIQERDDSYYNEHEYFLKAKGDMQRHHHDRVSDMMKQWGEARQRVAEMKVIDPKGALRLEQEVTERFQRTYEALEQEGMEEKRQLSAIHQQRVQGELNNKKRYAMEKYMDVLQEQSPDANEVTKALRHYIKTEEKDRLHSLNHFRHMQREVQDGPDAVHQLETLREQALDRMGIINQRIAQAVQMVDRAPQAVRSNVRQQAAEYLETFKDLDRAISNTLLSLPESENEEVEVPAPQQESEQAQAYENERSELHEPVQQPEAAPADDVRDEDAGDDIARVPLMRDDDAQPGVGLNVFDDDKFAGVFDDETMEDERDLTVHELPVAAHAQHADHMSDNKMSVKMMDSPRKVSTTVEKSRNSVYGPGTTAAIACAAIAVFVILIVGALTLRRRGGGARARSARGGRFMAVSQQADVTPEERHVANMQMNGYENPTYKYFEMNAAANA